MSDITRYRGDTVTLRVKLWEDKKAGIPFTLTDCTVVMTVDPEKEPVDDTNNLFSIIGDNEEDGVVAFAYTSLEADQDPGNYFYDMQITDANSKTLTIPPAKYKIKQDITK